MTMMMMMILPFAMNFVTAIAPQVANEAPSYVSTRVEIDIDPLVDGSPADNPKAERMMARRVADQAARRLGDALAEHEIPLAENGAEAVIKIRLEWKVYLDTHYLVRIEIEREGESKLITETLECVLCNDTKLADLLVKEVPGLLGDLEVRSKETGPGPEVVPERSEPGETGTPEPEPSLDDTPRSVGRVGYGGIAASVLGIGGIVGGAVLLAGGEKRMLEPNIRFEGVKDPGPWGTAYLSLGGVALVTGVVLIVVDQTVLKKRRAQAANQSRFRPNVHPQGGGVVFSMRF